MRSHAGAVRALLGATDRFSARGLLDCWLVLDIVENVKRHRDERAETDD